MWQSSATGRTPIQRPVVPLWSSQRNLPCCCGAGDSPTLFPRRLGTGCLVLCRTLDAISTSATTSSFLLCPRHLPLPLPLPQTSLSASPLCTLCRPVAIRPRALRSLTIVALGQHPPIRPTSFLSPVLRKQRKPTLNVLAGGQRDKCLVRSAAEHCQKRWLGAIHTIETRT